MGPRWSCVRAVRRALGVGSPPVGCPGALPAAAVHHLGCCRRDGGLSDSMGVAALSQHLCTDFKVNCLPRAEFMSNLRD